MLKIMAASVIGCVACGKICSVNSAKACRCQNLCLASEIAFWIVGWANFKGKDYCEDCLRQFGWTERAKNKSAHFTKWRHQICKACVDEASINGDAHQNVVIDATLMLPEDIDAPQTLSESFAELSRRIEALEKLAVQVVEQNTRIRTIHAGFEELKRSRQD